MPKKRTLPTCLAFVATVALVLAGPAYAKVELVPAEGVLPGPSSFWAGPCDTAAAPAFGDPVSAPGTGVRPDTYFSAGFFGFIPWPQPAQAIHCLDGGNNSPSAFGGGNVLWTGPTGDPEPPAWLLPPATAAGSHPDGTLTFTPETGTPDNTRNVIVDLPPGFVGDPNAVEKCTQEEFGTGPPACPPQSQVGVMTLFAIGIQSAPLIFYHPVYNLEPRPGFTAEFGIPNVVNIGPPLRIFAKARTDGDFGVTTGAMQIPISYPLYHQTITIWGVPWAAAHDVHRVPSGANHFLYTNGGVVPPADRQSYDPSWGPIKPFVNLQTECDGIDPETRLSIDSYRDPGNFLANGSARPDGFPDLADPAVGANWLQYGSDAAAVTGCGEPPFDPSISLQPTSGAADSASGLDVGLAVPQNNEPPAGVASDPGSETAADGTPGDLTDGAPGHWRSEAGRATAHLDKTVVTLPAGLSVNPSASPGLTGCSDAQIGLVARGTASSAARFNNGDPFDGVGPVECPQGSQLGTVEVDTPLLDERLTGEFVLGMPDNTDPRSGGMLRLFIVVRNRERGLVAKIAGSSAIPDGNVGEGGTGQLVTTFDKNPRVPFEHLTVKLKGGDRGLLAMPRDCRAHQSSTLLTPWTAAHGGGGASKTVVDGFAVGGDCSQGFAPGLDAGMDDRGARNHGKFSFRFDRRDGEQYFDRLTAKLPRGLLANVKGLPLCTNAQAGAGACPGGSRIGTVDSAAGAGNPFVLEKKGQVFLTEGYKGGEYGLAVVVPAEAGPFRAENGLALSTIVVRQAIHVDRKTAQVTAISDPFPRVWHGVPLRVRSVTVQVDRPAFMLNPSDCSAKQVGATIVADRGASSTPATPFQASGCADLRFKPRLGLALKGRRQVRTGKHPAIRAVVRQRGIREAGIQRAEVRLPKTLALDVDNAQALCEFEDGTKPDLENHCPEGSIVGRARAQTPLLNDPLVGNVYFVKNVRIDPDTGNEIRTLPMIIAALRGEIAVNLVGESDVKRGKLVSTFANIPDAPISQFNMNIRGGRNGIVAVTRTRRSLINLCSAGRQIAEADMDGQNGKRHDFNVNMRKPCPKRRATPAQVCRKRTNTKPAMRRCVRRVKANRSRAAKRKAAVKRKQAAAKRRTTRG